MFHTHADGLISDHGQTGVLKTLQLLEGKEVHWYGRGDNTGPSQRSCHGLHLMKDQLSHANPAEY